MKLLFTSSLSLVLLASTSRAQIITSDAPLSRAQKKEIAAFVEDIASTPWQGDFQNGAAPNDALIFFGIYHTALRNFKLFRRGKTANDISLSASHVRAVASKYLGRAPIHRSIFRDGNSYAWTYRNNFYFGYAEMFEQQGIEKISRIQIQNARSKQPIVTAQWPEPMGEGSVRARMTLKRIRSDSGSRWILWSYQSLVPR